MKRLVFITVIVLLTSSIYAQEKAFEIHSGIQKNIYNLSEGTEKLRSVPSIFLPQVGLSYYQSFDENIFLKTGFTYYTYSCDIAQKVISYGEEGWTHGPYRAFKSISIPIGLGYKKSIGDHFGLSLLSGINLDCYFDPPTQQGIGSAQSNMKFTEFIYDNSLGSNFNILLENRLSFSYTTSFNLRFSVSGSYHSGLFSAWRSGALLVYEHSETDIEKYEPQILSRGSYFLIDFGLAYVFK